jgi:hypothetical protein
MIEISKCRQSANLNLTSNYD